MKGYVLVRYADEEVLPAVIEDDGQYVSIGQEVMLDERAETAIAVTSIEGYGDADNVAKIAKLFHRDVENLPRVIGMVYRDYWKKDDPDLDWRRVL